MTFRPAAGEYVPAQAAVVQASARRFRRQRSPEEIDAAIRQLVAKAIVADEGIIDVITAELAEFDRPVPVMDGYDLLLGQSGGGVQ